MASVKMRTTSAGPSGTRIAGSVYQMSAEEGEALVRGGYASWVDAPAGPVVERAVSPRQEQEEVAVERAALTPNPRKRRGRSS